MKYELHRFCTIFRRANAHEKTEIVASMKSYGYDKEQPITLYENAVLDGAARQDAAEEAGVEPMFATFTGSEDEAIAFVIRRNKARKQLTRGELDLAGARLVTAKRGRPENPSRGRILPDVKTCAMVAQELGRTSNTIDKARQLLRNAAPNIIAMVEADEIGASVALDGIRGKNKPEQESLTAAEVRKISNDYKHAKSAPKLKQPTWGSRVPKVDLSKLDIGKERIDGQPVLLQPAHIQRLTEASIRLRGIGGRIEGDASMDIKTFEDDVKKLLAYIAVPGKKNGEERNYANEAKKTLKSIYQHINEAINRLCALRALELAGTCP